MDKYDVYEILYRGFIFCAITIGMLYFVMCISGVVDGLLGLFITVALYTLWLMVAVGTATYLVIIMKGTFRPREIDTIEDLISELETDDVSRSRMLEILELPIVQNPTTLDECDRVQYVIELIKQKTNELDGEKSND
jgi:hypothetical protein